MTYIALNIDEYLEKNDCHDSNVTDLRLCAAYLAC